jgi:predicted RNA-binding protein with PUA-like domain
MRELTRSQSTQSKEIEIVNYHHQWHILKPSGKRKAKRSFTVSVKTRKATEEKVTLKGTKEMARLRGSSRKMNRRDFLSINPMRAGHFSLKASLSRFDIVPMAECECGDKLRTEEHIF